MTLIFQRDRGGPSTHAFVIGVGDYPHVGNGFVPQIRDTAPIASAADSAKLVCDWLLANSENLVAPLASIEVLISDPPGGIPRYPWEPPLPVDSATMANVLTAGERWIGNFAQGTSHTAFFFGCGHGASLAADPVVFLEELNRSAGTPWVYLHVASLARSLRAHPYVESAYIFVDACGEKVLLLEGSPPEHRQSIAFYPAPTFGQVQQNKVMLMSAAPEGMLAYEAALSAKHYPPPYAGVKVGRFTQTLIKALNGSSVREWKGRWTVNSTGLRDDLKKLKDFYYPAFDDHPFEPTPIYGFNEVRHFAYPRTPVVPIMAKTRLRTY